jgi:hypothetical protein
MLLTDRRRAFARREDPEERDPWQGSLFAPDAPAPAARPPGTTPDPFSSARIPPAPPPDTADAPAGAIVEAVESVEHLEDPAELEPAHAHGAASRSLLAGPTLDDVMSRVWEGLRADVPTPCPVCHSEIEPSAHGRCGACGSTLA